MEKNNVKDKVIVDQSVPATATEDKAKRPEEMKMIYLDNAMTSIKQNPVLMKDIEYPQFLGQFLRQHFLGLTIWGDF